ncbi:MAG TPA: N-acetylmuramoyl-L-alanine amidase [Enhygromyxa sp.]|nr:N-acetylmuramoyl-L-alanine amidase [Enhygromyxa sp.]
MRYGDQGHEVRALQRALLAKGYALPKYGDDGDFGQETRMALERFASDRELAWKPDDELPEPLLHALGVEHEEVEIIPPSSEVVDLGGVELYDLRGEQTDPHPKSKKDRHGNTVRRSPMTIDSIVLHQTAIRFSAPSNELLARRGLGVACHAIAFYPGFVAWTADVLWYIYHADRLNARSLGLEVDGNYPGLIGGRVANGKETPLTNAVVKAARMGVKLLVEEGRRAGCPIKFIYGHRQCDSWRRADPGQGLWQRVVLEYAVPELELIARPTETFSHPKGASRKGRPIPTSWDPDNGVGKF